MPYNHHEPASPKQLYQLSTWWVLFRINTVQSRAHVYNEAETTWPVDFGFNITNKAEVLIDYTCYPVNNNYSTYSI